jgi:sugar lactone lactonase YvrE
MVSVSVKGSEYWSNEMSFVFYDALSVIDEEVFWPNGVDVDDAGNVYIGASDDKIVKIAPDGTPSDFASVPVKGQIRFGPENYLYVCEKWEGKIVRISPDGTSIEDVVEVSDVVSFDWDADGNMYIVSGDYGIFMLDTGGNLTEVASDIGSVKNCRVFGGYLYVNEIWEGVIVRYPLTGSGLGDEELVLETDSPSAFDFDSDGRMYYAKAWEIDLYTLEPDGSEGEVLYEGQLMTPMRYMTFHGKKLYIVYPGWGDVGMTMSAYIGVDAAPNYGRQ